MSFKRGFKSQAEDIALELRDELQLSPTDPLDPFALAQHLEIPVCGLEQAADNCLEEITFLKLFSGLEADSFSAMTVFCGNTRLIIYNEFHAKTRQASDLAHEIAHCLLEHPPTRIISPDGCRHWNSDVEAEADWLAAALLVPRSGALHLAKKQWPLLRIAANFGVSETLCRMRINQTGIGIQLSRAAWY